MGVAMLKTVEGDFQVSNKEIAKKSYHEVRLRRGIDIDEKAYSEITERVQLNERQYHTLFGDGKVLPVAFERWENDRMQFIGIPIDIQGIVKIGKMPPVKASLPTHPSVTHYSVSFLVPDEATRSKVCEAVEKASGIKVPLLAEERVLGNAAMKLSGGAWVGEFTEGLGKEKLRVGVRKRGILIELDSEVSKKSGKEMVALRYTFSKAVKLIKIEARAPSGEYVRIADRKMKEEIVNSLEVSNGWEMSSVKKEFGSGKDGIVVDYLITCKGKLMKVGINGTQHDAFSLRPAKVQKRMKEFMANKHVQEWYSNEVAKRKVTQELKKRYIGHIAAYKLTGDVVKLNEPISFAGHEIASLRFMGNDLVTRTGPYGISVGKESITVSWIKEEKESDKETNIMVQFKENEIVLCEGGKHLSMVTNLEVRNGRPYLKALNSNEIEILEREKKDFKDGFLSIREVKNVIDDPTIIGKPSMVLMNIRLRLILEYEEEINKAVTLCKDVRRLRHNHTIEAALEEHLKKKSLPRIEK